MKIPKILAPVGSFKMLASAINADADEVYFGIGKANMRAGARANFEEEDLKEILKKCKAARIKTNLTLNIITFDDELEDTYRIANLAKEVGVDCVIAMDLAVIKYCHSIGLETHASVQAGITNYEAVKVYSQYCDRVVLARECSLKQQAYIINKIQEEDLRGPGGKLVEIEVFVHGALCVSVSGKCGMSLLANNKSASRGECLQPCRRKYEITDLETGQKFDVDNQYVMSSGDLSTIGMLDEIVRIGVDVLKIEGRGKNPEYVDMVVRTYKKAIDSIQNGTYTTDKIKTWSKDLQKVYNRKLTNGYYLGEEVKVWSSNYGSYATEKKLFVGKISHFYPKARVVEIYVQSTEFQKGDEIMFIGTESGVNRTKVLSLRDSEKNNIQEAKKGMIVTITSGNLELKKNDDVYLVVKK